LYIHKQNIFRPYLLSFSKKDFKNFGSSNDLESPLGFFSHFFHFTSYDSDELLIYVPYAFSIPERIFRYGPEISALYAYNEHKDYFVKNNITLKDIYSLHWKKYEGYKLTLFNKFRESLGRKLYLLSLLISTERVMFHSLKSSQHFYHEGIKFYDNNLSKLLFIGSSTPGILIPEEFFGEELYFPGITKTIKPQIVFEDYDNENINDLLNLRLLLQDKINKNETISNPFRIPYFTMGLAAKAKKLNKKRKEEIFYSIYKESALKALKQKKQKWAQLNKATEYEEDIKTIYKYFSRLISINFLDLDKNNSLHHEYTLIGDDGYWYISEREEELKKISKGVLLNAHLIKNVHNKVSGLDAALITTLTSVSGAMFSKLLANNFFGALLGLLPSTLGKIIEKEYPEVVKKDAVRTIRDEILLYSDKNMNWKKISKIL